MLILHFFASFRFVRFKAFFSILGLTSWLRATIRIERGAVSYCNNHDDDEEDDGYDDYDEDVDDEDDDEEDDFDDDDDEDDGDEEQSEQ